MVQPFHISRHIDVSSLVAAIYVRKPTAQTAVRKELCASVPMPFKYAPKQTRQCF